MQRGRARLHELANKPEDVASPSLSKREREQLVAYVDRFNARDFDAILTMLAADVRLDLVNRLQAYGRTKVGEYFHRYALGNDLRFVPGFVDGRPAILGSILTTTEAPLGISPSLTSWAPRSQASEIFVMHRTSSTMPRSL